MLTAYFLVAVTAAPCTPILDANTVSIRSVSSDAPGSVRAYDVSIDLATRGISGTVSDDETKQVFKRTLNAEELKAFTRAFERLCLTAITSNVGSDRFGAMGHLEFVQRDGSVRLAGRRSGAPKSKPYFVIEHPPVFPRPDSVTAETAPLELLKAEGRLVIFDGASFFEFKADGSFESLPVGISGRTLNGRWQMTQAEPLIIEVLATQSWLNGVTPNDDYRKLSFTIYRGKTKAFDAPMPSLFGFTRVFDGYWLLQEFSKVAKPAAAK